jgi:hypothetical protein
MPAPRTHVIVNDDLQRAVAEIRGLLGLTGKGPKP